MVDHRCKITAACFAFVTALLFNPVVHAGDEPPAKFADLMTSPLAADSNIEVTVSRVRILPNFTTPRHYHPGEVFVYVMDGSVTIWQQGKPDVELGEGEVFKIPPSVVHSAITGSDSVTALVFRVLESGQPERVLVK